MHARRLVVAAALAVAALAAAGPAAAQPNQIPLNVAYPANVDYPSGQPYGEFDSTVLGESYVQGAVINLDWSSVEPTEGTYSWGPLDTEAEAAYNQGKHIILVVRAANEGGGVVSVSGGPAPGTYSCTSNTGPGQFLPQWELSNLKTAGPDGTSGTFCDGDLETIIPDWFSSTFQNDFLTFVSALGQHVSQQSYYANISYVRIGVGLGGEGFPLMPDGTPGCSAPCQTDAPADLAYITSAWVSPGNFAPAWETFQESMLTAYRADFPAVTIDGAPVPAPPLIYPISVIPGQPLLPDGNPVDYDVADWATASYSNIGIGEENLPPTGGLGDYADFENILPMVFANNPDVYVQFQTGGTTTTTADEAGIITAAKDYGARSIEWYESTFTQSSPPSSSPMTTYQAWVNDNCNPGCPVPSNPATVTPAISGFTPTSGAPGTRVTITGQNLWGATVTFDGTVATVVSLTATQIVATVPAGAATGAITVTTAAYPAGITTSTSFTVT
jgi:hypothetical protein